MKSSGRFCEPSAGCCWIVLMVLKIINFDIRNKYVSCFQSLGLKNVHKSNLNHRRLKFIENLTKIWPKVVVIFSLKINAVKKDNHICHKYLCPMFDIQCFISFLLGTYCRPKTSKSPRTFKTSVSCQPTTFLVEMPTQKPENSYHWQQIRL